MVRISLLFLAAASVSSFTAPLVTRQAVRASTAHYGLLTDEETNQIVQKADDCAGGECSVEDVSTLLIDLREQEATLKTRLDEISKTVMALDKVNSQEERPVNEIRETIRAIMRIFILDAKKSGNDYPALSKPTGWSGEVGKGSTTAYKALAPKPYKPTK